MVAQKNRRTAVQAEDMSQCAQQVVDEHPAASMFVLFTVGLCAGVCIGQAFGHALTQHLEHQLTARDRLSRQFHRFCDSVLPAAVTERLHT